MFSFTTIILSLSLLASQSLAAPNASGPSKHARWFQTPRTLRDPDFLKRNNLAARDVGFSLFEKKDIFQRQTLGCDPTEVTCQGNMCCPAGYNCASVDGIPGCCPVGQTCNAPPVGCADPTLVECPNTAGCCPVGQTCVVDSTGVPGCDSSGQSGSSSSSSSSSGGGIVTPTFTPTIDTSFPTTTPVVSIPPLTSPTTTTTTSATSTSKNGGSGPATGGGASGAEKMAIGMGGLTVMMGAFVVLA